MKLASRTPKLPALSCAAILSLLLGAAACGEEAPLPVINPGGGSGGTTVIPGGGSAGTTGDTGGTGTTTAGSGGSGTGTAGTTPLGGSGGSVSGGSSNGGSGGTGTGGTAGAGTSGSTGTAGSGGSGGSAPIDLKTTVGGPLNGAMLTGPCLNDTAASVCQTKTGGCPAKNPQDPSTGGALTTDKMITLGGDPAKTYTITLHVQGEVEAKKYNGGQDQSAQGSSPKLDGFCTGGTPSGGDDYNVYLVRVASPKQDYFLNSLIGPGVSNHTTYGMDYTAKIKANGGTTIRLVAADTNCSMIKNCGPQENTGNSCSAPITLGNIDPVASSKNPNFNFGSAYNGQWIVMVVTDVTQD